LVRDIQTVRGLALREAGSKGTQLEADGRHVQPVDAEGWHIVLQHDDGTTVGCARYLPLNGNADQLGATRSTFGRSHRYGPVLHSAMERLISNVKKRGKRYGEAGGWAMRREIRGGTAAVNVALMTFALAEHLGSGLAFTTATKMHHSSSILCRIGANRIPDVPAYYEAKFGSILEVLQFDLPNTNPRYASRLEKFREQTLWTPIICAA
jgi:hypothetical protein